MNYGLVKSSLFWVFSGVVALFLSTGCGKKPVAPPAEPSKAAPENPVAEKPVDPKAPEAAAAEKPAPGEAAKPETPKTPKPQVVITAPTRPMEEMFTGAAGLADPANVSIDQFNGTWVGHDSQGRLLLLMLDVAAKSWQMAMEGYDEKHQNGGEFSFNETSHRIVWGCEPGPECAYQAALTAEGNLYLAFWESPARVNRWRQGERVALLVPQSSPQAVEYTSFRGAPPISDNVVNDFESFKAALTAGGEHFSSTNSMDKLRNLEIPPNEDEFVWLIKPKADQLCTFPIQPPPGSEINDPATGGGPGRHFSEVELEAFLIPGKMPPDGKVQLVYEALLDSRKTERRTMTVSLNPGVNRQNFKFDYIYYRFLAQKAYSGGGTFTVYLMDSGSPARVISNILKQKFVFE